MPLRILESIAGFSKRERIAIQRRNKKEKILKSMYEKLLENGQTVQQIAALFGYTVEYVQSVLSGKTTLA